MLRVVAATAVLFLTIASSAGQAQADSTPTTGAGCKATFCDGFTQRNTQNDPTPDNGSGDDGRGLGSSKPDTRPWWEKPFPKGCIRTVTGPYCPKDETTTDPAPTGTQLREVVAKLKLPDPTPRLGPDPSVNEWNMLAVGYPIWLWTDQPTHLATTAHHDGLTFTLDAQQTSTTFDMGDGNTKTCTATTPYTTYTPKPSPTCGYTYETPSPVGHPYTLTATTTWTITWQATGHHGTLTHTTTGTRTLDVGELQSLIIG